MYQLRSEMLWFTVLTNRLTFLKNETHILLIVRVKSFLLNPRLLNLVRARGHLNFAYQVSFDEKSYVVEIKRAE